jgi:hypothetical protein
MIDFAALHHMVPDHVAILLYIGPDVFMPLISALAAVVGAVLLFWQKSTALVGRLWRVLLQRGQSPARR